jgi:dienelactone hydrolase
MSIVRICMVVAFVALALSGQHSSSAQGITSSTNQTRPWTITDSVAVRYLVTNQEDSALWVNEAPDDPIVWAPDAQRFFFVTHHGDLVCDCVHYELFAFNAGDLNSALVAGAVPSPESHIVFDSASSNAEDAGIVNARWSDDRTISFIGFRQHGPRSAWQLHVNSNQLEMLSDVTQNVRGPFSTRASSAIYVAVAPPADAAPIDYPITTLTPRLLSSVITRSAAPFSHGAIFFRYRGSAPRLLDTTYNSAIAWLSPDGAAAILEYDPLERPLPPAWRRYERPPTRGIRFMVADLRRSEVQPVFDAPVGGVTQAGRTLPRQALWYDDGQRVILFNTALPLASNAPERRSTPYIVFYDVARQQWTPIDAISLTSRYRGWGASLRWLQSGEQFLIHYTSPLGDQFRDDVYTLARGHWARTTGLPQLSPAPTPSPPRRDGLRVYVREDANTPPVVIASSGERETPLIPPDPALLGIQRAGVVPVTWIDPDGQPETGGLMLPPSIHSGARLPLVVQAFSFTPQLFRPDGPDPTAYAAQALVSRGFAVLLMNTTAISRQTLAETPDEYPYFVRRLDAAVSFLALHDNIDTERIGLVGFSRAGTQTYYAITHPGRTHLGAVVVADSHTAGYAEYVTSAAITNDANDGAGDDLQYGGSFWQRPDAWIAGTPGFNVANIQTPALFVHNGLSNVVFDVETIGALRMTHRPFDYLVIRDGDHQLVRPRERAASMEATLDWMRFWLMGEEDLSPMKNARFDRWRQIRADWLSRASPSRRSSGEDRPR